MGAPVLQIGAAVNICANTTARTDAIRHMIDSGIRPIDIVALGIPKRTIERALRTRGWLRLAPKAVRS